MLGKMVSKSKRRSLLIIAAISASAASDDLCKSKSKRSSQTDINGTSTQRKEGNDSVGKNAEPENLKESGKEYKF